MSIKIKLAFICTLIFLAIMTLITAFHIYQLRGQILEVLAGQNFTLVTRLAGELDEKLLVRRNALVFAAATIPPELLAHENLQQRFIEEQVLLALFDDVFIFSDKGVVVAALPLMPGRLGADIAEREYFKKTFDTGWPVVSSPYAGRANKQPTIMMTAPIRDSDGKIVGILGGSSNLLKPNFLGRIGEAKVGKSGYFYIFTKDERPVVVTHPNKSLLMTPATAVGASVTTAKALQGFEGTIENSEGPREARGLFSYKSLEQTDWILAAFLPNDEALAPMAAAEKTITLTSLIVAAAIAPLIWFFVYRLLMPLAALHDNIRQIREHPEHVSTLPVKHRDEIGDLTKDFNILMSDRQKIAQELMESENRLRTIADNMPALIGYIDKDLRYRFNNQTYEEWYGIKRETLYGRTIREVLGENEFRKIAPHIATVLRGQTVNHERELVRNGVSRYIQSTYLPHTDSNGEVLGFYVLVNDISERKAAELQLTFTAHHDALTGLPNRTLFHDRLAQFIGRSERNKKQFALMYLDIDNFKTINDTFGHSMGDKLLRAFGARLTEVTRATDTVARFGGDEFVIIFELTKPEDAELIAGKIVAAMQTPFQLDTVEVRATTSIGVAIYRRDEVDATGLLEKADAALYRAKDEGRNIYVMAADEPHRHATIGS